MSGVSAGRPSNMLSHTSASPLRRLFDGQDDLVSLLFEQGVAQAVIDGEGRVLRINSALRRALGGGGQASGANVTTLFAAEARDAVWHHVRQHLDGAAPPAPLPPLALVQPGTQPAVLEHAPHVVFTAVQLREADGRIGGLLLQLADVTPQVALEVRLARSDGLRLLGRSVGGIAHDFNNLLGVVLAAASAQLSGRELDDAAREDLLQIRASAERGAALVRQLLRLAHDRGGETQIVDVAQTLHALAGLLRVVLRSNIRLAIDLGATAVRVRVDPALLDRILLNLCVNAGQAMEAGGTLTLALDNADIDAVAEPATLLSGSARPGRYVVIAVRDTGPGISPVIRARLSEPFATTREGAGGSGLGLWSVCDGARRCGGFVTLDSAPGHGTVFRVHLPYHDGHAKASVTPPPLKHPECHPERGTVLLVDDEPTVLRLAARTLERAGWCVLATGSGPDGLAAARAAHPPPRLVVTDLAMLELDGAQLIHALRAFCPALPAILTSGYADPALADVDTSPVLFLPKPYTTQALLDAVQRATAVTRPFGA